MSKESDFIEVMMKMPQPFPLNEKGLLRLLQARRESKVFNEWLYGTKGRTKMKELLPLIFYLVGSVSLTIGTILLVVDKFR